MRRWIALILLLLLCACTADAPEIEPELPEATELPAVPFAVSDATETFSWIGKTVEELKIGDAHLSDSGDILFSGDLFGHEVRGTAYLLTDWDDPARAKRVNEIWLTDAIAEMPTVESALSVRYGEPYATDVEPYVESNGGETYRQYYWTGEGVIELSNGAKNDFYVFTYSVPKDVPREVEQRTEGLTTETLGHRTGVYFHFADGEAEDLAIAETAYEGLTAYLVTFTHENVPYRVTVVPNGEPLFAEKTAGLEASETVGELATYRFRTDDGGAVLYETNAFGQLWIVETDAALTADELAAFESFLLNRWLY